MQMVVSMYLDTVGTLRMPVWVPRNPADDCLISRPWSVAIFTFLQLDQESLEFGRPGIWIHRRRSEEVRERPCVRRVVLVAPMDGESDVPERLAADVQRPEPLGHHRHAFD